MARNSRDTWAEGKNAKMQGGSVLPFLDHNVAGYEIAWKRQVNVLMSSTIVLKSKHPPKVQPKSKNV
eukprot:15047760-Ditylum_brightwellii.AAC.1